MTFTLWFLNFIICPTVKLSKAFVGSNFVTFFFLFCTNCQNLDLFYVTDFDLSSFSSFNICFSGCSVCDYFYSIFCGCGVLDQFGWQIMLFCVARQIVSKLEDEGCKKAQGQFASDLSWRYHDSLLRATLVSRQWH